MGKAGLAVSGTDRQRARRVGKKAEINKESESV